eukprot:gnl/Dysnectes_brevis/163_a190_7929.p1 GENE.gnl/Dysnectes_brevis/163_a190_7929~~gnl/Dysnectes_brevis/163_a190_7929.p1  ORF type:complete len:216 (+),score=81.12 gnl/Dysnectes_brevis/163_a190_7929:20-667(+)
MLLIIDYHNMSRHPSVKWAQRKAVVYVCFSTPSAKNVEITFSETAFTFKAESKGVQYEETFTLKHEIDPENSRYNVTGLTIEVVMDKKDQEAPYWPTLTTSRPRWIRVDFDRYIDSDDEDKENEADFADVPGMPGMGAGGAGMDMSALQSMAAGMGGAGGAGGMPDLSALGGMGGAGQGFDMDSFSKLAADAGLNPEDKEEDSDDDKIPGLEPAE